MTRINEQLTFEFTPFFFWLFTINNLVTSPVIYGSESRYNQYLAFSFEHIYFGIANNPNTTTYNESTKTLVYYNKKNVNNQYNEEMSTYGWLILAEN